MNSLHGDHTTNPIVEVHVAAAVFGSHETGAPCTTLVKGWAYDSYSFRTIDFWGVNASAE
jgi:hypothetical protein